MRNFKHVLTLVLAAVLLWGIFLPGLSSPAQAVGGSLVKKDGSWYYMENGKVRNITTLVKFSGSWWYVVNGKVASNTTSLVKYNGEWWYVVNGKVASNTTTLVKYNGEWWYVVKGKIASNTTSLIKYNNEWWYVVKGKVASKTTALVKWGNEWWYVVKGKIAAKTTTLVKHSGAWYYIVKGKLAANTTTLVNYSGGWYYVNCGQVDNHSTTLVPYSGKWYSVVKGKVDTKPVDIRRGAIIEKRYDSKGRLSTENNVYSTIQYSYNSKGYLSQKQTQYDGSSSYMIENYHYNKNNKVEKIEHLYNGKWDGETVYTYYSDGSYLETMQDAESTTCTRYNSAGKITYIENLCAGVVTRYYHEYNSYGDVSSIKVEISSDGSGNTNTYSDTHRYEYNAQKKPISNLRYMDSEEVTANYYAYNSKGLVERELEFFAGCVYLTVYTYDKNGNCLTQTSYDVLTNRTLR